MLRVVTAATADPVALNDAKAQLRIALSDTSQDAMITALIAAATLSAQALTQRLFMTQTVEWVLAQWRSSFKLPIAPVSEVNSIKYVDWVSQTQQTLDASLYVAQTEGAGIRIFPKFGTIWPIVFSFSPEPIVINFVAGYADATKVPANVKQAILLTVRHLYSLGEQNIFVKRDSVMGVGDKYVQVDPGAVSLLPDAAALLLGSECWE